MPTKSETILKKIESLPDHQSKLCLQFKEWCQHGQRNVLDAELSWNPFD